MDYATMADAQRQSEEEAYDKAQAQGTAKVAELIGDKYLNIKGAGFFDLASYAMEEFDKKNECDEEFTLMQLVIEAYDNGDPLLKALAAPYYNVLRRHAAKLAEAEVSNG